MPDGWVCDGPWRFCLLSGPGVRVGAVQACTAAPGAEPGRWWATVAGIFGGRAYPSRPAAMRAVMLEAASNKRLRERHGH